MYLQIIINYNYPKLPNNNQGITWQTEAQNGSGDLAVILNTMYVWHVLPLIELKKLFDFMNHNAQYNTYCAWLVHTRRLDHWLITFLGMHHTLRRTMMNFINSKTAYHILAWGKACWIAYLVYNNIMYNTAVYNYDQTCFTHRIIYQNIFFFGNKLQNYRVCPTL